MINQGNLQKIFGAAGFNARIEQVVIDPPEVEMRNAIKDALGAEPDVVGDGQIHRFDGKADKKRSCWYLLFSDGVVAAGAFGDWRDGSTHNWRASSDHKLSFIEQQQIARRVAAMREAREAEQASWREEAATKAEAAINASTPASPDHPYLKRKGVGSYGIFEHSGVILVPMVNGDGRTVKSYQSIDSAGTKKFLKGGQASGCYHSIPGDTATIYIGEGYATCATVFEATGATVLVAFSASNLPATAKTAKRLYPASRIVILVDNDDAGREWSAKCDDCEMAFAIGEPGHDFNDMGVDATREVLGVVTGEDDDEPPVAIDTVEATFSEIPDDIISLSGVMGLVQSYSLRTAPVPNKPASALGAIALIGSVLANKVQSGTGLRTNNYFVLVAGTGQGKEHPRKVNKAIIMMAGLEDHLLGGEEFASGQGVLSAAGNRPSALFQSDEFGDTLQSIASDKAGSFQKAIMSSLMKLHSGAGSIVTGQERADQRTHPRADIRYPCINLFATSTASQLVPAMKSNQVMSGFFNRMMFLLTKTKRIKRNTRTRLTPPPAEILDWVAAARSYRHGLEGTTPENPITIQMDRAAESLMDQFEDEILKLQDKGSTEEALYVRAWEHAAKLALIRAMSRMSVEQLQESHQCVIDATDALWGISFVRYVTGALCRMVNDHVSDSEFAGYCNEVARVVHSGKSKGRTESELSRYCRTFRGLNPLVRDMVINALLRDELMTRVIFESDSGRGRKRVAYVAINADNADKS